MASRPRPKDLLGEFGEQLAARHLTQTGFLILDRNWRCPDGEIDIVAADGDTLVICEVKTRRSQSYGTPLEAVDWRKVTRLHILGSQWAKARRHRFATMRIDVVAILAPRDGAPHLRHLRGVS